MLRLKPTKEWEARVKNLRVKYDESVATKKREQVKVYVRCVFERIIEVDTKSERYDADVILESSWKNEDVLKILIMPQYTKTYNSKLTISF